MSACSALRRSVILYLLMLLMLCACGAPSFTSSQRATGVAQSLPTPEPEILTDTLHCTNYVETEWGTRPGEFGLCPPETTCRSCAPPRLSLSAQGDMYVLDEANRRILRYSGTKTPQVISINNLYEIYDIAFRHCGCSSMKELRLGAARDQLFLLFSTWQDNRWVDQLAILSLEGRVEHVVDLGAYYPLRAYALIPDEQGGVYLIFPPAGIVYFDANLRSYFQYMGSDDPWGYFRLTVGWDGNLYTYQARDDVLFNWGGAPALRGEPIRWQTNVISITSQVTSSTAWVSFLGADTNGRLYYELELQPRLGSIDYRRFVRISSTRDQIVMAIAPAEERASFLLAPDGSLYSIVYDPANPSVRPGIIKCSFDRD